MKTVGKSQWRRLLQASVRGDPGQEDNDRDNVHDDDHGKQTETLGYTAHEAPPSWLLSSYGQSQMFEDRSPAGGGK